MRPPSNPGRKSTTPRLINQAKLIHDHLKTLEPADIKQIMHISDNLTSEVREKISNWPTAKQFRAVEYFAGDIYTGLDVSSLNEDDLEYAQLRLCILSGLYGLLRPLDLITPYRLEMGYRLSIKNSKSLYDFWSPHLKEVLPVSDVYIHLSSEEYFKAIRPLIDKKAKVIAPLFLTSKDGTTKQVTIHSKVARGAYANWLIKNRVEDLDLLPKFNELDYSYSSGLSSDINPTYIKEVS